MNEDKTFCERDSKENSKKISLLSVIVNLQVSAHPVCILQNHLTIYSSIPDFPEQQHYKKETLKYINSESTTQRKLAGFCSWHKHKVHIINKYLEEKKTREKTHHKVIELFGLVSIFDCSDNRCSNFSLSQVICSDFFFPSYYKQTSKNGGGDGRLQICTTGE